MFRNYFTIALRQMGKQKMYALIKIGGFALSIAACILIALFIQDEVSYDKFYPNRNNIFRLYGEYNDNGKSMQGVAVMPPMAKALKDGYPEVEKAGRIMRSKLFKGAGDNYVSLQGQVQSTYEEGFSYADQEFLDIMHYPFVYGNPKTALKEPLTLVMTRKKAEKLFPGQNPVGKILYLNEDRKTPYTIGGVMEDLPANSHLQFDYFLTLSGKELWPGEQTSWQSSNYDVYLQLRPGTDYVQFSKKITSGILHDYILPTMRSAGQSDTAEMVKNAFLHVQPVNDIYLKSYNIDDSLNHGDIRYVWLLGAIALFILIIASINFINLSTAKSSNRAKEVGLRKVVGSQRSSLLYQFLTESFLFSILSVFLGILIAAILLPQFNTLAGKSLEMPITSWWFIPAAFLAALFIGFVAGLYPAFYLSSFSPIQVLKGQVSRGAKNNSLRNGLVIFQFTASVVLIICTIIIYQQTHFILNRDLGFEKDQVIMLEGTHTLGEQLRSFKQELEQISAVKSVSVSDYLPIANTKRNGNQFYNQGKTKLESGVSTQVWIVDEDYIKTMGMKLVAGRNFSEKLASDTMGAVINQALVRKLQLKDPIGKTIENGWETYHVIGVLEDFNYESMRSNIEALVLRMGNSNTITSVKVNSNDMKSTLAAITAVWKKFAPATPIRYNFMDESFARMYSDVQRMGVILTSFAILAISIACLGLFALSAFMAEQRTKEVGIRKVLGATIANITAMLSKDFLKLVLAAIVIASPIAWWAMSKWLQDFVYRVDMKWWVFAGSAMIAIIIALVTISFQSIKAALANPVKSLKSE
ncbi:ABC transporter permease [Flavihumibacter fluvii]|uniref:ABC transporter permease n=1 Tax=Flavihumibacter fluvii TaxID=2838157 RepID=UPI001BDF4BF6|nr:ABC transporter permease [Flavihumibacter fluvii]ULQ54453.1 ABC transporter permease [Flavihumibacter fluvii]